MDLWQAIDLWQECLVAMALLAAVVYLLRRVRRAGRPDASPTCTACEHCHASQQPACEAGTGPQGGDSLALPGRRDALVRVDFCGNADRRNA